MKFRFGLNLVVDVSNRPKKSSKFIIWINIVLRKKKPRKHIKSSLYAAV